MSQTLNSPTVTPAARQPRLRVLVNGQATTAAVSASVSSNNWYHSDTFSVTFATSADPAFPPSYWQDQQIIQLDIRFSVDGGQSFTSFIVGNVDTASESPESGTVTCTGRDLSSLLIEAPTQEQFLNKTSSQIAIILAGRHGLTPQVTATTSDISRFFEIDKDHTTLGRHHYTTTEWDLLSFLAKCEGFDLYLKGTTLVFQPSTALTSPPWVVQVQRSPYVANVLGLQCEHHKTLAHAITVEVRSFTAKTGKAVLATATSGGTGASNQQDDATKTQVYRYVFPNMSQTMANQRATALLTELKNHERSLSFHAPGDLVLTPRSIISLSGTGSPADMNYYADTVTREIDFEGGFRMNVTAKNRDQRGEINGPQ